MRMRKGSHGKEDEVSGILYVGAGCLAMTYTLFPRVQEPVTPGIYWTIDSLEI